MELPKDMFPIVMGVLFIGIFAVLAYFVYGKFVRKPKSQRNKARSNLDGSSVSLEDVAYLASVLSPNSTTMDVLFAALSTPEMLECAEDEVETAQEMLERRKAEVMKDAKKKDSEDDGFAIDGDGWGDDNDEHDDGLTKLKQIEKERQQELDRLKVATGQKTELMEGVDEGVLGQAWVERTLESKGQWPPKLTSVISDKTLHYKGKKCQNPLDHLGLRRYLCMTMGRLNAQMLNTHPELLEAGGKKKIDQTYFKSAVEFRSRVGIVLEAILRLGVTLKCTQLVATTVEAVGMFKLGTTATANVDAFRQQMQMQFGCHPGLAVSETSIEHEDYQEIAAGESANVYLTLERTHAENFVKVKVAQAQKQGLPPQVALQSYREGWWFLLCLKRVDGPTKLAVEVKQDAAILAKITPQDIAKFQVPDEERLLQAWPMMVQNCAQKSGKIKVQFTAPEIPGKYKFVLQIKSQDFLGSDQLMELETEIVSKDAQRTPKPAQEQVKKDN